MLYSVTLPQSTPGGSVELKLHTVNGYAPAGPIPEGTKVYINLDIDYFYVFSSLTVTDSDNNSVEVTGITSYKYYFYMPANDVSVSAAFSRYPELSMGETTVTLEGDGEQNFVFTPQNDGWYKFTSDGSFSSNIEIFNESGNRIYYAYGDQNYTVSAYLEGGKSYKVRFYTYNDDGGDISVSVANVFPYPITVIGNNQYGSISVYDYDYFGNESFTVSSAPEGHRIKLVPQIADGCLLNSLTVTDSNGASISLSQRTSNSVNYYFFTMPAGSVTVTADIAPIPALDIGENTVSMINSDTFRIFTPQVSGYYRFYSDTSEIDPKIYINNNGVEIANHDDIDGSTNRNFDLTVLLEAGVTYDIHLRNWSNSSAEISVFVEVPDDADKSALIAALEKAGEYSAEDYSAASFDELQAVIAQCEDVADQFISQQTADEATAAILTAISNLVPYLNLNITSARGAFSVNDIGQEESFSSSFLFGESVSLIAYPVEGYNFVCWFDTVSKRIVSYGGGHSFTMTSNTSLEVIRKAVDSGVLVFMTDDGFVAGMVEKTPVEWGDVTDYEELAPPLPYRLGATEGEWNIPNNCRQLLMAGEVVYAYANYNYPDDYTTHDIQEPTDSEPALDLYYELDSENNVGSFIMTAGIPDDIEVESIGIAFYYKKANLFNPESFDLTINNKTLTSKFEASIEDGIFIVDVKNFTNKYNWAARGYVTYYDDDDGELKVAYTNQINIVDREYVNDPNSLDIDFPGKPLPGIPGWNG